MSVREVGSGKGRREKKRGYGVRNSVKELVIVREVGMEEEGKKVVV